MFVGLVIEGWVEGYMLSQDGCKSQRWCLVRIGKICLSIFHHLSRHIFDSRRRFWPVACPFYFMIYMSGCGAHATVWSVSPCLT